MIEEISTSTKIPGQGQLTVKGSSSSIPGTYFRLGKVTLGFLS